MASKNQMTGMLGVYLTAAELTRRDMIVSPTSRSARGVDLFATDHLYRKSWSIQVKTNSKTAPFWLLHKHYKEENSEHHVYVFVNLRGDDRPEYLIVPSQHVADHGHTGEGLSTGWYAFYRDKARPEHCDPDGWSIFAPY